MIVLYEGVFDPPHINHQWLIIAAQEQLHPEKVIIMPSSDLAGKYCSNKYNITSQTVRYNMCKESFKGPDIIVSRLSINKNIVYTIDVINEINSRFKPDSIYWLCGSDWLEKISYFKSFDLLKNKVIFLIAKRGFEEDLSYNYVFDRVILKVPFHTDISSTMIRNRVKNGMPITGLVSPGVNRIIKTNNLYGEKNANRS